MTVLLSVIFSTLNEGSITTTLSFARFLEVSFESTDTTLVKSPGLTVLNVTKNDAYSPGYKISL